MNYPIPGEPIPGAAAARPAAGEVIEVVSGEVLVFAELPSGRRLPMTSVAAGCLVVGCEPTEAGITLLVIGQADAMIRRWSIADALAADLSFDEWIFSLSQAALGGKWATKVVSPDVVGSLRLAPGEVVSTDVTPVPLSDRSVQGWLKVTSGAARFCGCKDATVGVIDPAIPIVRGTWLTSGLRCQIGRADAPTEVQDWTERLDLVARLALCAVDEISQESELESQASRAIAEDVLVANTLQGVDSLVGAVVGPIMRPSTILDTPSAALAAAFQTLSDSNFTIGQELRERAQEQVVTGREPFTAAAAACNARARKVDLGALWWQTEGPPLVALTTDGNPLSLRWSGNSWTVLDPVAADGHRPLTDEIRETFSGQAWEFLPILPHTPVSTQVLMRLGFQRASKDLIAVGVLTLGLAFLSFFTPFILGQIAGSITDIDTRTVLVALATLVMLLVVSTGWQYVRGLAMVRTRVRGTAVASGAVWDRLMRLRTTWHDQLPLGDRMTQATAVTLGSNAVPDVAILGVLDTVVVLGGLTAVATTTPSLLLATTVVIAVQLLVNVLLTREGAKRALARITAQSATNGTLLETLRAVNRLRVSGAGPRAFKRWSLVHAKFTRADIAARRIAVAQSVVIGAWPIVGLIVIVAVAGATGATFGEFVTTQAALALATISLAVTAASTSALFNGRAIFSKVTPVLNAVPEGGAEGTDPGTITGAVVFTDIVFRYEPGTPAILDGVDLQISPGEQIAIVGPSGCGKTTLMRILLGLEEPESGVVTIDGQDLAVLDRPSFRRQVGSVLQSSTFFPGSIRDNVDMGRGMTSTEIWQALEWACVADEVRVMGMGLDTPVVDGGGTVSGGQRQRILLARALASNPRMLILDEATSALDNVTQGSIVTHLQNLRLTRILIAHRLSTIQSADRIIVLADGQVAQQGSFDELVSQPGHFADLVQRQTA